MFYTEHFWYSVCNHIFYLVSTKYKCADICFIDVSESSKMTSVILSVSGAPYDLV